LLIIFGDSPRWSVAAEFQIRTGELDGLTPQRWLVGDRDVEQDARLAGQTAARWRA
jgi:hypothetical protein